MIPFSNAIIRLHLGQIETVAPKPVSLYEPVRHTDFGQTGLTESVFPSPLDLYEPAQHTDFERPAPTKITGISTIEQSLNQPPESDRIDLPTVVQTPIVSEQATLPQQRPTQYSDTPSDNIPLPVSVPLSMQLEEESSSILTHTASSVPTNRNRHAPNNSNIMTENIIQTIVRHVIHTQIEKQTESNLSLENTKKDELQFKESANNPYFLIQQPPKHQRATQPNNLQTSILPTIKVSIGRIEVKAVVQAPAQTTKSSTLPKPRLSLEDYLKKQDNHAK